MARGRMVCDLGYMNLGGKVFKSFDVNSCPKPRTQAEFREAKKARRDEYRQATKALK